MKPEQISEIASMVKQALEEAANITVERDHLRRVLKQAVLSNGGKLMIDAKFAQQAFDDKRILFIGSGGVTLENIGNV